MRIVLFEPEIPPNTGNIARLCAASDIALHLIEPLGFSVDNKHLRRAGLDYWPHVDITVHPDFDDFLTKVQPSRLVLASAKRGKPLHRFDFHEDDCIVMGPETRGLPAEMFDKYPDHVNIPMNPQHVRSLNLSTATGILLYEALRATGGLDKLHELYYSA
ncbi:MAG: tRNA (cytidine(34)-2'-O)-methyltransferase [Desulfovibrio sp.]